MAWRMAWGPDHFERSAPDRDFFSAAQQPMRRMLAKMTADIAQRVIHALLRLLGNPSAKHRLAKKRRARLAGDLSQVFHFLAMHGEPRPAQLQNFPRQTDVIRMKMRKTQDPNVRPFHGVLLERRFERLKALFGGNARI